MDERLEGLVEPSTRGIEPAQSGALRTLQQEPLQPGAAGLYQGGEIRTGLYDAALAVNTYQRPTEDQAARHKAIGEAAASFTVAVCMLTPPGPERSTALSRIREARAWANAAVALEGK